MVHEAPPVAIAAALPSSDDAGTNAKEQFFISFLAGVTCWIPAHLPTEEEKAKGQVVLLSHVTGEETESAMMIFFHMVALTDDPNVAMHVYNAKTPDDVVKRIMQFRAECSASPMMILQMRFNPQAAMMGIRADMMTRQMFQQRQALASRMSMMPQVGSGTSSVSGAAQTQQPTQQPLQQPMQQPVQTTTSVSTPAAGSAPGRDAAMPPRMPKFNVTVPDPYALPPDVTREEVDAFLRTNKDLVFSAFPRTHIGFLMRTFKPNLNTRRSFRYLKGGSTYFMNPDLSELNGMTPIRLHEDPVCMFFLQKNTCARPQGCTSSHFNETQLRDMIAVAAIRHEKKTVDERRTAHEQLLRASGLWLKDAEIENLVHAAFSVSKDTASKQPQPQHETRGAAKASSSKGDGDTSSDDDLFNSSSSSSSSSSSGSDSSSSDDDSSSASSSSVSSESDSESAASGAKRSRSSSKSSDSVSASDSSGSGKKTKSSRLPRKHGRK